MATSFEEEVRELRRWRHDLEGMGIMQVPGKVDKLEALAQKDALDNVRIVNTIDTLKDGFTQLKDAIQGFHSDIRQVRGEVTDAVYTVRRWAVGAVVTLSLASMMPPATVNAVITAVAQLFR
jgi:hypothetical protein